MWVLNAITCILLRGRHRDIRHRGEGNVTIKADIKVMLPQSNTKKKLEEGKKKKNRFRGGGGTHKKTGMANGVKMHQKVKQGNTVLYYWRWDRVGRWHRRNKWGGIIPFAQK